MVTIDFAPQATDLHVINVGLRVEAVVPHVFQQHGAGDCVVGIQHEIRQQPELTWL